MEVSRAALASGCAVDLDRLAERVAREIATEVCPSGDFDHSLCGIGNCPCRGTGRQADCAEADCAVCRRSDVRGGNWIQTYPSGLQVYPLDPRPDEIRIEDVAHHLAMQCRFVGGVRFHYSVAQHSVLVSRSCDPADERWGLLHDAAEYALGDLPRPLKRDDDYGRHYRRVEARLMRCVCTRFGLDGEEPESVLRADRSMLLAEKRDLLVSPPAPWGEPQGGGSEIEPWSHPIERWSPEEAEGAFLARYRELFGGRA